MFDPEGITGVVLAGGKSTRMGQNKARLLYQGRPLISYPIEILSQIFPRVLLSVNEPGAFPDQKHVEILDRFPETGPLGAILSVLLSGEQNIFCVACDMPFLNKTLIQRICETVDHDAVIPLWNGRAEVLHALYSNRLTSRIQEAIEKKTFKITNALAGANIRFLSQEEVAQIDPDGVSFRNLNTPEDYRELT